MTVETTNHAVKLTGNVQSVTEKKKAEKVAFNAAGIYAVQNELIVVH
ncbi:BON domain-containing protein [uncultured Winogradskyella sp.]